MFSNIKINGLKLGYFLLAFLGFQVGSYAQGQVALEIIGANVFSNCTDIVTQEDFMYGVSIEGGDYLYYPKIGPCHTAAPNVQWSLSYECSSELRDSINLCFQIFENDGLPFTCQILKECLVERCFKVPLSKNQGNTNSTLSISPGNDSWGDLFISLRNSNDANDENDLICNAVDLGSLTFQDTIGTKLRSDYQNLCATNFDEFNPADEGSFQNDAGVWFRFQTRDMPSSIIQIEANSDPSNLGDPIDLELALFTSDQTCSGNLSLLKTGYDLNSNNASLTLTCLNPNQTYYLLVDGRSNPVDFVKGYFGLQISAQGVIEGQDIICNAAQLQSSSGEGSVIGEALFSNFCSSDQSDSTSAWFEFTAPESGNVLINNLSQSTLSSTDIELALFQLGNGDCQGQLELITSTDNGQSLEASCLYPGEDYYVLVKSNGTLAQGIFNLTVADAGLSLPPQTSIESVQCYGGSYTIGDTTFTASGDYSWRIPQAGTCDSLVNLNLTILDSLTAEIDIVRPATNLGIQDGAARVRISGGSGNYTIEWCDGSNTIGVDNLEGGQTCCVQITDEIGCSVEVCFEVPYLDKIVLDSLDINTVNCAGEATGMIQFIPKGGVAPYRAVLQGPLPCDNCGIVYRRITGPVNFSALKAGQYQLQVFSRFQDTILQIEIAENTILQVDTISVQATSCAGVCDGLLEIAPKGGLPPYNLIWQDNLSNTTLRSNLCAGSYTLNLIDSLGCAIDTSFVINAPPPIDVQAQVIQAVSCEGANNGIIQAVASENDLNYQWNSGQTSNQIEGLGLGTYSVSVTNSEGCTGQASVSFENYEAPLSLSLALQKSVSCNGGSDGFIEAQLNGAGQNFTYIWSDGSTQKNNTKASAGLNSLIVQNELGCTAQDAISLDQPTAIEVAFAIKNIDCIGGPISGRLNIDSVSGGNGGYSYAIDGGGFTFDPELNYIPEGNYMLQVRDQKGCQASFPFELEGPPDVKVTIPENEDLLLGDSITIRPRVNIRNLEFFWFQGQENFSFDQTVKLSPQQTTGYIVQAFDPISGCSGFDTLLVSVDQRRRVYIANVFSPNGDQVNDYFGIQGDFDIVSIAQLSIYNRNGALLFNKENLMPNQLETGWDGLMPSGEPAPAGTYIYLAKITFIDGKTEVFRGDVSVIR